MKRLSRRQILRIGVAMSGAAILAACSPPGDSTADPTATGAVDSPAVVPSATANEQAAAPADAVTPAVEEAPSQTPPVAQLNPTRTDPTVPAEELTFHPTDPSTVQLAAGRPQFVEFFAFW